MGQGQIIDLFIENDNEWISRPELIDMFGKSATSRISRMHDICETMYKRGRVNENLFLRLKSNVYNEIRVGRGLL